MTTASAPALRAGIGLLRGTALLGFALALTALLLLIAGPLGWRAGWWRYTVAFTTLLPWAAYCGIAAMAVSLLALAFGALRLSSGGIALAILGFVIGGVATYFPWQAGQMRGLYPRMNDVTTDFDNPPSLAFAETMRKAEQGNAVAYGGPEIAALQRKSYGDIAPAMLAEPRQAAFDRAVAVAQEKGWTILKADPGAGVIEAYDRSRWFGFADDIAIRVGATPAGSRIDIRSGSRQGRGDFGVNATRVRGFLAALKP